jgi:retron-type reverse transcriptase
MPGEGLAHGPPANRKAGGVNHILDADVRDFFGSVNHNWLIRFLEHRIGDERIIRLIRKWLKAGGSSGTSR